MWAWNRIFCLFQDNKVFGMFTNFTQSSIKNDNLRAFTKFSTKKPKTHSFKTLRNSQTSHQHRHKHLNSLEPKKHSLFSSQLLQMIFFSIFLHFILANHISKQTNEEKKKPSDMSQRHKEKLTQLNL